MNFFLKNFKWLMLVSGLLTCTMTLGLFDPQGIQTSTFGENLGGPVAEVLTRNWAALIGLMGMMLIYGAFVEPVRRFALVVAGASKAVFITLILIYGKQFMAHGAGTAVIADSIMVILYLAYLALSRRSANG